MSKLTKAACILLAIISAYAIFVHWQNGIVIPFDKAEWQRDREALKTVSSFDESSLQGMARDLVATRMLVGQSRSDVIALLGEAENYGPPQSEKLYYLLRITYHGIDPDMTEHLVLNFDQSNTVVSTEIEVWNKR